MRLPQARGPVSDEILRALRQGTDPGPVLVAADADPLTDDDLHLALWALYELHYRGFDDVDPAREWDPELLRARRTLEAPFEQALRAGTATAVAEAAAVDGDLMAQMEHLVDTVEGPRLAAYLQRRATTEQLLDFLVQRSLYHLKESDPASFVLPRVDGPTKVALAELQYDEYGGGRPHALHATLFGDALEGAGLDRRYGAYVDQASGTTLAVNNAMSLFGLHRRLRGAALGHLAAFELTSSLPCRKIAGGIERLGMPPVVAAYFHEHVEADAVHEQVAVRHICGGLLRDEPGRHEDVLFGAAACLFMDAVANTRQLQQWQQEVPAVTSVSTATTGRRAPAVAMEVAS